MQRRTFMQLALAAPLASVIRKPVISSSRKTLSFDFPDLRIGTAEYAEGPTGCTVFHFPKGAFAVADIRGGAPATIGTDHLRDGGGYVDAICLAGGSSYGLEAATGVASELLAQRRYSVAWDDLACVAGAIIYDFRPRQNAVVPDRELGRAALRAARVGQFPLGGHGAGISATCGKWLMPERRWELAGQGGSVYQQGPVRIGVFSVVNSLGAIIDRSGAVVRGQIDPATGRHAPMPDFRKHDARASLERGNTTLTMLVTNVRLPPDALRQLARGVHTSMARAIQPFHAPTDGDVLFAASTNACDAGALDALHLLAIASECAWDAVLSSFADR